MISRAVAGLAIAAMALTACGTPVGDDGGDRDPGEAVLRITSEGGFAPVEMILAAGPRYTLLGDGTLIYQGVQTLQYPGPLLPPYLKAKLNGSQMNAVLAMVERIGLPEIESASDDTAAQFVADATTEVITYWDEAGSHVYSVYALGFVEDPSEETAAFKELVDTLDRFSIESAGEPYEGERVRVLAGEGAVDPGFADLRPWPLDSDPSTWEDLPNGWSCQGFGPETLDLFADATQATTWESPVDGSETFLLVRPLHPGEPDCP